MSSSMIINVLEQSTDLIERYANCILRDFKGSDKTQILDDLSSYVLYFSKSTEYYEGSDKIFEDIANEIDATSDELNCDDVLTDFNERIKENEKKLMNEEVTERYNHFKTMFLTEDSKIDDDITTVCQNLNTIDPVSKLPITDPVRNKTCGHVYEKRTIIELIERNPRTKCPIVGCNALEFIRKSDLVPDTAMKRMLSQSAGNSQKKMRFDK